MKELTTRESVKVLFSCFFVVILCLFLYACGGGGTGLSRVDISDTWIGDHTKNGIDKVEFSFIATQRGDSITGDIAWNGLGPAIYTTYTGTISGLDIALSWSQAGTAFALTGAVSTDGSTMSGTWTSSDGTSGTWQTTRYHVVAN